MEYTGGCLHPYASGDLDADGRSELIGQSGGYVHVYESPDAASHPTELVWSSAYLSNVVGDTAIGDTDRDGRMEILHSQNSFGGVSVFLIFENTGDNDFAPVFGDTIYDNDSTGQKAIADFDGDGLIEIAFSGFYGRVYVYESTADDTWRRTWTGPFTGLYAAYAVSVGEDTDRNGRPELFVMGSRLGVTPETWTTAVYEASDDNFFEEVASLSIADGFTGEPFNLTVNLDNLGRQEYLMDTKAGLWIYRSSLPGQWDVVDQITDPGSNRAHAGIYAFDLNQNGRPELIWTGSPTTLIFEHRSGISDVRENSATMSPSLSIFPNPCRLQAQLRAAAGSDVLTRLSVFDAAGRLVERRLLTRDSEGQILWPTRNLACGVYLLRLENAVGHLLASGRATITR